MFTDCNYAAKVVTTALIQVFANPNAELNLPGIIKSMLAGMLSTTGMNRHVEAIVANTICNQLGQVADKLLGKAREKMGSLPEPTPEY
jgi:hypothetical protein